MPQQHISKLVAKFFSFLAIAAMSSVILTGCSEGKIDALVPASVGDWVTITEEQAFESELGNRLVDGSDEQTIDERMEVAKQYILRFVSKEVDFKGDFKGDFKDGAVPTISEIKFYAPKTQQNADAPTDLAIVAVVALPEVVGGDESFIEAFQTNVSESLDLPKNDSLVYVTKNIFYALDNRSLIFASGSIEGFTEAYADYIKPFTE